MESFDGTVDWNQFVLSANKLMAISKSVDDNWNLRQLSTETGGIFLEKIDYKTFPHFQKLDFSDTYESEINYTDSHDPQEATQLSSETVAKFEYHIVYSISYSVPVLYFTINKPDGSLVRLEEIWECIPKLYIADNQSTDTSLETRSDATLYAQFGSMLTQMEHPLLMRPFYAIHPCHTSTLLKNILSTKNREKSDSLDMLDKENYLITWLSTIGPIVGIKLSLEYAKHLSKQNK